jgi:hypothetical protein
MNFFKKLFSSKQETTPTPKQEAPKQETLNQQAPNFDGVYTDEYFSKRYEEENIYDENGILDGCLKMIEGYFIDNKIEKINKDIINHPQNLDLVMDEGFGFGLYCKAFDLSDKEATLFLCFAFSDFIIKQYDFKLYRDNEPEFPLRFFTLKYDKNGTVLSIYPFEYAVKVLNYEAKFVDLHNRIESNIGNLPSVKDVLDSFIKSANEE